MFGLCAGTGQGVRYLEEIFAHAGVSCHRVAPAEIGYSEGAAHVLVLAGDPAPAFAQREWLTQFVEGGGVLVAVGGVFGLSDLLGAAEIAGEPPLAEGYLALDSDDPLTCGLRGSLHIFGAARLRAQTGEGIGRLFDSDHRPTPGDALVVRRVGAGIAVTVAADIPGTVLRIQQGRPIHEDGPPAPDGTAPIDEGILKTDDGVVLSWLHDRERTPVAAPEPDCPGKHPDFPAGDTPWFSRPVADELRVLLLRVTCWAAASAGHPVPLVWQWPRGLPAVGLISHDSDYNLDASAHETLRQLREADIRTTWCQMWGPNYPDRYSRETFAAVIAAGHETALHYNALPVDGGTWGEEHLRAQLAWLREQTGLERFASNKNHFLRWEGTVECFRWLEGAGIGSDQSKGPSKRGNVGYAHGSCQPWFPYDEAAGRFLDVLEIPLQTQDLWLTAPPAIAGPIFDAALAHGGVAHFLFHQIHLYRLPGVAAAMRRVIEAGRERGLSWWTGAEIAAWERARREITVRTEAQAGGRLRVIVRSPRPLAGLTLAVIPPTEPDGTAVTYRAANDGARAETREWHGLPAVFVQRDVDAGESVMDLIPAR